MMEKTCGNCMSFDAEKRACGWTNHDGTTERCEATDTAESHRCFDWEPYVPTADERAERLEQVAKRMLGYLASIKASASPLQLTRDTNAFRERLEELGVSLDG